MFRIAVRWRSIGGGLAAVLGIAATACGSGGGGDGSHMDGAGNPVNPTACPETYAYGFRNPWRMNFDPARVKGWGWL